MIIVSGWLRVAPGRRDAYLASCHPIIEAARQAAGCVDFHLAADPLDDDRVNVFEQWQSADDVDVFRGTGPESSLLDVIVAAQVHQHEIASTVSLT